METLPKGEVLGVYQSEGGLFALTSQQQKMLRDLVFARWIDLKPSDCADEKQLTHLYKETLGTKKKISASPSNSALEGRIDPELINKVNAGEGTATYLNCSHHGLLEQDIFINLRNVLGCRILFYIHDLIPIDFSEYVREGDSETHTRRMHHAAVFADVILVNSEFTRKRFLTFCKDESLEAPPCEVLVIGVEPTFISLAKKQSASEMAVEQPYFITIGTIEPRKNHLLLLNVWRDLIEKTGSAPKLVIVGKRGWSNQNTFDFLDRCEVARSYIHEYSDLPDTELIALLKGAQALLFPSFSEGWGMPLVEAIAAGTPVISSDIEVFHEASQERALFIDPVDGARWREAILEFAQPDSKKRRLVVDSMAGFVLPTWEQHFQLFDAVLKGEHTVRPRRAVCGMGSRLELPAYKVEREQASEGLWIDRMIYRLIPARNHRKYEKFKRSPVRFLADSRKPSLRTLGEFLSRGA